MKIKKRSLMIFHNFCRKASLLVRVFLNKIIVFLRKYHRILITNLRIIYNFKTKTFSLNSKLKKF